MAQASAPSTRQPPRDLLGGLDSPDRAGTDEQAAARAHFKGDKADDGFYRLAPLLVQKRCPYLCIVAAAFRG